MLGAGWEREQEKREREASTSTQLHWFGKAVCFESKRGDGFAHKASSANARGLPRLRTATAAPRGAGGLIRLLEREVRSLSPSGKKDRRPHREEKSKTARVRLQELDCKSWIARVRLQGGDCKS